MSAAATGLMRFVGMTLQVEPVARAPVVGQPKEVRTTLLPLAVPEKGLKITVFAAAAMLVRFVINSEKSPRRIAAVGTVKSCGSAMLSLRCSYENRKKVRSRPLYILGTNTGPFSTPP